MGLKIGNIYATYRYTYEYNFRYRYRNIDIDGQLYRGTTGKVTGNAGSGCQESFDKFIRLSYILARNQEMCTYIVFIFPGERKG